MVSEEGIKTDPSKTEAIRNWKVPTTIKEVRSFLGFASYYRKFVENFATIARPLNDLLAGYENKSKKRPFVWGQQQQKAFETLIDKLCTTPVLAYANYNKPFILHTDASLNGLGAVLYQMQDDNTKRVVANASRSL